MNIYEDRFKPLFLSSGMTDKDLETSIGLPRGIIYKWEHDVNKSFEKYCGLVAKYFNVSADYLLGTSDKKETIPVSESEIKYEDNDTKELREIWGASDGDERKALLEMARLIKKRREKNGNT